MTAVAFASAEETRASAGLLRSARTLSAAESAAWETIGNHDWNAAMALHPGQQVQSSWSGAGGQATVIVARLDTSCFLIQAQAEEAISGTGKAVFRRRLGVTIEVAVDSAGRYYAARIPLRAWVELF